MGKRKKSSRKPTGPKKSEPLATSFSCLFCNHEKSVTCMLDKKAGVGSLSCKVCGQRFQANINYLSAAIDVYSEWVDACDEIANPKDKAPRRVSGGGGAVGRGGGVSLNRAAISLMSWKMTTTMTSVVGMGGELRPLLMRMRMNTERRYGAMAMRSHVG
ncbi:unnamed protein product [Tuber aestivum]|uniref:Transcription elongation factor 1 homolog n=1 Tax=Tuber aestivum TaxID=59557 RepID=A0A292PZP0_9PEZI|nr:unnamed protein product [Tuber aestivum]